MGAIPVLSLWLIVVVRCVRAVAWHDGRRTPGSMTAGMAMLAATATVLQYSTALDAWTHVNNLGALLRRWILGVAWLMAQPLLAGLFRAHDRRRVRDSLLRRCSTAATLAMMVATGTLWLLAPVHDTELVTLNAAPGGVTSAFVGCTYVWMIAIGVELAVGGLRVLRAIQHDVPGRVCSIFMIATGVCAIVGAVLLVIDRVLHEGDSHVYAGARLGTMMMPLAAVCAAASGAAVPVLEWCSDQMDARRTIKALTPAWRVAGQTHPETIMSLPRWTRVIDAPLVAERMRIEILDAEALNDGAQLS